VVSTVTKQKLKTHKGAKRRFKITATGKVMRAHGMKSHFRRRKAPRVKRQFDRMIEVEGVDKRRITRMLPNGL
jgi:large subunit ribosomal protein L35